MKHWKEYQKRYNEIVKTHTDDLSEMPLFISSENIIEYALEYVTNKPPFNVYPGKSYIVAIIYATLLNKEYGINIYDSLNDPDLFLGDDPYFKIYSDEPNIYNEIIDKLDKIPNWIEKGWAPQTVKYFYAECTAEGCAKAIDQYLRTGIAVE